MIRNENIICISSIDWNFVWQGHQEIMSTFAKNGNRVLFIENTGVRVPGIRDAGRLRARIKNWLKGVKGIRKEMDNLYVYSPLALPFPYSRIARWINKHLMLPVIEKWMRAMDFNAPIVWTFLPTGTALEIVNGLDAKLVIYYCIADFTEIVRHPHKIGRTEKELLEKTDIVFAQGTEIKERCSKCRDIYIFPFGVNIDVFKKIDADKDRCLSHGIKNLKRPIFGYIGGIHKHIDFLLLKHVAERNPDSSIVLIGPVQTEISLLKKINNIFFIGKMQHTDLPYCVAEFDACLIPYAKNDYTATVYPTKLNEYCAMGKPVISTDLTEIKRFNDAHKGIIYIGASYQEFDEAMHRALNEDSDGLRERRRAVARENSWKNRIEEMSNIIEKKIREKGLMHELQWKERLVYFYNIARQKILRFGAIFLLLYLLFFKTAFIWFLAGPLKISEVPRTSDAIVVFGGGVGETGGPGKSTIERARYASELYHKGYADKIIFSSGYTYTYNDAENMKIVALSMGIPLSDIILEPKANSTYENVLFSKKILDHHGWDSILLISSPYHMRRAQLVFNKWDKERKVFYVPVEKSEFYDRRSDVRIEQIRAIMHEYLGIVYYWFSGYI
jgi:uncharacterized SAM-binding protein YcdF (DUF218 family)/glycosyltransferase involved in cell wall biosynthesis